MNAIPARLLAAAALALAPLTALAGGTPENILLIINPSSPDSLYIGNYYKNIRKVPDQNVLYLDPSAANFQEFTGANLDALAGLIANRVLSDHIDYILVTPGNTFFIPAPGLISDGCFPVGRFSTSSVFTTPFVKDTILAGGLGSGWGNMYYSSSNTQPIAFDSNLKWLNGSPSNQQNARRYYIGAMLGYTGERGNSLAEITAMIDRSVASDGTRPTGTFYFMNNTSDPARNIRNTQFTSAVNRIIALGGKAEVIVGQLPIGKHDALGILTGFSNANIIGADMTILPGAFADHLTSYAATFDEGSQTKMSEWIVKGTSGTAGTVEEPCNYPGKFPHSNFHAYYYQGLSLGESYLRSVSFTPFQSLLMGDPMTRTFAYIPTISVPDAPKDPVSGVITMTPSGVTTRPGAIVNRFELYIDGTLHSVAFPGDTFTVDTAALDDGWHDMRVVGYDNHLSRGAGRWMGPLTTDNHSAGAAMTLAPGSGNMTQLYTATVSASGGAVKEFRLLLNGRVIGTRTSAGGISFYGRNVGAGTIRPVLEAEFADGRTARSAPGAIIITNSLGNPSGNAPVAFSFSRRVLPESPFIIELPASLDTDPSVATYALLSSPAQATVAPGTKGYRIMTPKPGACGTDSFTFRVTTSSGQSNTATVTLRYAQPPIYCPADFDQSGELDIDDFIAFQTGFGTGDPAADFDGSCSLDVDDFIAFQTAFGVGCP